jgi:hypothetical protein
MTDRRTGPAGGHWLLLLALLAAGLPGCKGEYENRLEKLKGELGKGSDFNNVLTQKVAINFPSASVTLSLPADLTEVNAKADPQRAKLTLGVALDEKMLGDLHTYEGAVDDAVHGKQHYYLYVGSVDLVEGGSDDLTVFCNNLRRVIPSLSPLDDVSVITRDGLAVTCRKCRATLQQVFYYTNSKGGDEYPPMEGLVEIWDRKIEPAKKHLVMVWRVPNALQGKEYIDLDKKAKLIAGGIEVSAK